MARPPLSIRTWPTWLLMGVLRLTCTLPWTVQLALGRTLGALVGSVSSRFRKIVDINLALCLPQLSSNDRVEIAKAHFKDLGASLMESAMTWWASDHKILALTSIQGLEHITQAQRQGRGVILMTYHSTTLSIGARIINTHIKINPLYKPTKNKVIAYISAVAFNARAQTAILHTDVRKMIQLLKEGNIVWYVADQNYRKKGAMNVPFFNQPAATNVFSHRLAQMTNAEVLFYSCYRIDNGQYQVTVENPMDFANLNELQASIEYHHRIEKAVMKNPSQYWWVHKRFKPLNAADKNIYQ